MNNACITGLSPTGHCGAAAYCENGYPCCAACDKDCNVRCGWLDGKEEQYGKRTEDAVEFLQQPGSNS